MNAAAAAQVMAVAGGAAIGALLRWRANLWFSGGGAGFPLGTLVVTPSAACSPGLALAGFDATRTRRSGSCG